MPTKLRDSEADPLPRPTWPQALLKAAVIAGFFGLWSWTYDLINAFAADPIRTIHLTSPAAILPWIIQPWTAVIYILGGVIFASVPFLYYPSWRGITFVMACFATGSMMAFAIYWAWPVSMVRPEFAGGTLGERMMLWVFSVDRPANCFPSLHVIFAVLGAYLIDRAGVGRGAKWFWWAFAAAVCVTTVTSGQHYFIDVPGGVAVAIAAYSVGQWFCRPSAHTHSRRISQLGKLVSRGSLRLAPHDTCEDRLEGRGFDGLGEVEIEPGLAGPPLVVLASPAGDGHEHGPAQ
jgi:membrane-associated phospholipid phosphatase